MSDVIVIAGLSGAGRSQAANSLEDLGWFVIDNLPPTLIPKVSELASGPGSSYSRVALVVGSGSDSTEVLGALNELRRDGTYLRMLFLDASTPVLVRRYKETRRRHPRSGIGLFEAIEAERLALESVRVEADIVVDTSELNVHQLRARMADLFGQPQQGSQLRLMVTSFGFKHGLPLDVDIVLDCRFLPNPHWVEELRPQSGLDEPVREYVLGQVVAPEFLERVDALLTMLIPHFEAEGKSYLTVAFGCTGGRHRSVAVAEEISRRLTGRDQDVLVSHRDLAR